MKTKIDHSTQPDIYEMIESGDVERIQNALGSQPLFQAIYTSQENIASLLIKKFPEWINKAHEGYTPLHIAAQVGLVNILNELLDNKARTLVNAVETPLTLAIGMKHEKAASLLMKRLPVLVNQPNEAGLTPLYFAAKAGLIKTMQELITLGAIVSDKTPRILLIAIFNKHEKAASLLMQHFPMLIKIPREDGAYPLHFAAQQGLVKTVEELITLGADIHATKDTCHTAICSAAQNGHVAIIRMLITQGASHFCDVGIKATDGKKILKPLQLAARKGHVEAVELLLQYPHPEEYLKTILHETTIKWITSKHSKKRNNIYLCTELIKAKLGNTLEEEVLTLEDYTTFTWDTCFEKLYGQKPTEEDKVRTTKEATIRYALTCIYQLLLHPKECLPYIHFLSDELAMHWKQEHNNNAFPKVDTKTITFWAHQGNLWPIPKEQFQSIKKESLLERILLAKFKQYGMGEVQNKWTGFVPKTTSKALLSNNVFFTENRRTINGLTHGNMHNIQRVIMLYAMEAGAIPLNYQQQDGTLGLVEPKEVFLALMRTDISLKKAPHLPLWTTVFDSSIDTLARFTLPHGLHFMLLTNEALAGVLQEYMRFSFGSHYIKMRDLFNTTCETQHTNSSLCEELKKLQFESFCYQLEEAIQIEKECAEYKQVTLETDEKQWAILQKNYKPLAGEVRDHGDALKNKEVNQSTFGI